MVRKQRPKRSQVVESEAKSESEPETQIPLFSKPAQQTVLPAKIPNLKAGFEEIVKQIYDDGFDVAKTYEQIQSSLSIKGALTPAALATAANNTEQVARSAYQLYLIAKLEVDTFMQQTEILVGAIRDSATAELEKEKAAKVRTKQITDADVIAKCAVMHPDEWQVISERRAKAKGMVKSLENLHELAVSRCRTVAKMMNPTGRL